VQYRWWLEFWWSYSSKIWMCCSCFWSQVGILQWCTCAELKIQYSVVVILPTMSCYADWSKCGHVTLVIIGCCTLERVTMQHVLHVAHATCFHNVAHVARLFLKLAENENRTNTSNLWWVYWDNARMRMYGHNVQSINELFIAERNTN